MYVLLFQPSSAEDLQNQLGHLLHTQHKHTLAGRKSESSSFTRDKYDVEHPSADQSLSRSYPLTHHGSGFLQRQHLRSTPARAQSVDTVMPEEQVDTLALLPHGIIPSSTTSSDVVTDEESSGVNNHTSSQSPSPSLTSTPRCSPHPPLDVSDPDSDRSSDLQNSTDSEIGTHHNNCSCSPCARMRSISQSPSLTNFMPEADLVGGSPNFLHHWKRTVSLSTVWQSVVTIAKPHYLVELFTPSRLINMLIILL